ncbi:cytochrome P450 [Paraliomyxa miuraensis]|uniref:cytochrome P450 n=1 Tax=Paraliomyxa miuraensis TaxID=376150 RepID=UPI00224DC3AC|nr:cytochrome P450 [Paraliomyxa miuraensis]MCX4240105.1 cytochrome P450 [Paraliomyxa miuraensis]
MPEIIPNTSNLPILGALPSFLYDPMALLRRSQRLGDISRLKLGMLDAVALHHPDHVDHVLREHHRRYTKDGPFWAQLREMLGNGLPTSTGDEWRRHRRMIQPQFHRQRLESLTDMVVEVLAEALDWHDVTSSWQVIDVGARMPHLTMSVVSTAILGSQGSRARARTIAQQATVVTEYSFWAMITHRLPSWLPFPGRDRFARGMATMRREGLKLIEERRLSREEGDDLLALLIAATDEETGEGMSDAQLLDETMSLLLAGYDTTSNGLQWSLHLLAEHPRAWEHLREECDSVLRDASPRAEHLPRLRYARWVMQEALRLYPPAWWLPRLATRDDHIGDHAIAKGTIVAPMMFTVHRHADFWPEPERFDPERFDPGRSVGRHPMAWVPFGAGPRKCIGQELSLMESTLALAMFTQRFELQSVGHTVRPRFDTALRPGNGVRLHVRRRRPMEESKRGPCQI